MALRGSLWEPMLVKSPPKKLARGAHTGSQVSRYQAISGPLEYFHVSQRTLQCTLMALGTSTLGTAHCCSKCQVKRLMS